MHFDCTESYLTSPLSRTRFFSSHHTHSVSTPLLPHNQSITHSRSAGRASGVKAIYLGRMAGLKVESDLLRNMQTELEGAWRNHPGIKTWVLSSIAATPSEEASEGQGGEM